MDFLISFDDLKAGNKALGKLAQAFRRAGAAVATTDTDPRTRRTSGVNYRQVQITFTDNQTVMLGVKTSGDIFEVKVNGAVLPIKNQGDQRKAVGEIVKALDAGRAKFQAKLARQKVALPQGISTAAPRMEQKLAEASAELDRRIVAAEARVAELRAELGEPAMDSVQREKDLFWVLKDEYGVIPANAPYTAIVWAAGRVWANGGDWKDQLEKLNKERKAQGKPHVYASDVVKVEPSMDGVYSDADAQQIKATVSLLRYFRNFIKSDFDVAKVPTDVQTVAMRAAGVTDRMSKDEAKKILSELVNIAISRKGGDALTSKQRERLDDFQHDARVIEDYLVRRIRRTGSRNVLRTPEMKAKYPEIDNQVAYDSVHTVAGGKFDGGEIDNLISMAKHGKVEDGDVVSKAGRDSLVERGFVASGDGMNWLTDKGKEIAAALDAVFDASDRYNPKTDRWVSTENGTKLLIRDGAVIGGAGGKLNSAPAKKEFPKDAVAQVKAAKAMLREKAHTVASFAKEAGIDEKKAKTLLTTMANVGVVHDPTNNGRNKWNDDMKFHLDNRYQYDSVRSHAADEAAAVALDAVDVPTNTFDQPEVVEAKAIASRILAGDTFDDAQFSHALATLEVALNTVETNHPINVAEGNVEQADLEERAATDFRKAIRLLQSKQTATT